MQTKNNWVELVWLHRSMIIPPPEGAANIYSCIILLISYNYRLSNCGAVIVCEVVYFLTCALLHTACIWIHPSSCWPKSGLARCNLRIECSLLAREVPIACIAESLVCCRCPLLFIARFISDLLLRNMISTKRSPLKYSRGVNECTTVAIAYFLELRMHACAANNHLPPHNYCSPWA